MSNFTERPAPGTTLRVEMDVTVAEHQSLSEKFWQVQVEDDSDEFGRIHLINWQSVAVTKVSDPVDENWPPQAGDVWTNGVGDDYHVLPSTDGALYWNLGASGMQYPIRAEAPEGWELAYRPGESA